MIENRKNLPVTVLCGGSSSERPGSLLSGQTIETLLKDAGYVQTIRFDLRDDNIKQLPNQNDIGTAFVVMHGGFGEDGTLQGLLDMHGIAYTGCGVAASAISADKALFNNFVRSLGLSVPNQIVIENIKDLEEIKIRSPKIIKPATQGCSYGVFYVENKTELLNRMNFSKRFSETTVIEDYIPGRELSIGLYEIPNSRQPRVLPILETILTRPILDFESKYPGGEHLSEIIIPAKMDSQVQKRIEFESIKIFNSLKCQGYVRMDLRLTPENEIYWLENNTSPGMISLTESDYPLMLQAGGVNPANFVDQIVESTLIRYQTKNTFKKTVPGEKEMVEYLGLKLAD